MNNPFNDIPKAPTTAGNTLTLVNGRTFTVAREDGTLSDSSDGTVFEDLRMLSRFTFSILDPDDPKPARHLHTTSPTPFQAVAVSQPDPHAPASEGEPTEFFIHRQWVGRGVRHDIELHNASSTAIHRRLSVAIGADFAHLFAVKSGHADMPPGQLVLSADGGLTLRPAAASTDRVTLEMAPWPQAVDTDIGLLRWDLTCPARSNITVVLSFEPHWDGRPAGTLFPIGRNPASSSLVAVAGSPQDTTAWIETSDSRLATAFTRSLVDLASLRIYDPTHPERVVVAAGAPWFMTLFGRDSLLTSWMALPFEPDLATGVLASLADLQGTATVPATEEEPGKILHELRRHSGDAAFGERGGYYGTIDATPLFVMLAAETRRWGHLDDGVLALLWPHIQRAVEWTMGAIAADPAGFVTYRRSTDHGLVNQGWKDSGDGITYDDGRQPSGPIALAEVQGYAYAALLAAAHLAGQVTDPAVDADELVTQANRLRERFNQAFWDESQAIFALGVDQDGNRIDSLTTNPGHALWTGIADHDSGLRHLDRCMEELWSGWGLRTLSPRAVAYNPLSYHNGSVWPHDTALCIAGASRYGRPDIVRLLVDGALDAAEHFDGRPPELFAGIGRAVVPAPVSYPSSCSPQAWASASTLLNLRSALGIQPPATPGAPPTVDTSVFDRPMTIHGIRSGAHGHDLTA